MRLDIFLAIMGSLGTMVLENDPSLVKTNLVSWARQLGVSQDFLNPGAIDIGLRVAIYAVLFFSIASIFMKKSKKETHTTTVDNSVKSVNQRGGITAGSVFIGEQQRKLNSQTKALLLKNLERSIPIDVVVAMNDREADTYANEIKQFLSGQGYRFQYETMLYESMSGGRGVPYINLNKNLNEITVGPNVDVSDKISFLGFASRPALK